MVNLVFAVRKKESPKFVRFGPHAAAFSAK